MTKRSRSRQSTRRRSRPMQPLAEPYEDPYAEGWPPVLPPMMRRAVLPPTGAPATVAARSAEKAAGEGGEVEPGLVYLAPAPTFLRLAITLVPEVPLGRAVQMAHAVLLAAGDAIGAIAPPEVGIACRWPATLLVNGGAAGHVGLIAPNRHDDEVPAWLVVGLDLRLRHDGPDEPGHAPGETSLFEEGAGPLQAGRLAESTTRHFLSWLYRWEADGFAPLRNSWNARAEPGTTLGEDGRGRIDEPGGRPFDLLDTVEVPAPVPTGGAGR